MSNFKKKLSPAHFAGRFNFYCTVFLLACVVMLPNAIAGIFPGAQWESATPQSQGVDPKTLQEAAQYLKQNAGEDGVKELFIVRNGYVIYQGPNVDTIHGVWSVTKSFTSTALGLLIDDKKCSLETHAKTIIPEMAAYYPDVTLHHFTTMTSGYRAEGDEPRGDYKHGPSRTPFQPAAPLFPPGEKFAYWDSAMNQFAHILTKIAGMPLDSLFAHKIARPIGLDTSRWRWGQLDSVAGQAVNGGAGNLGAGIYISAKGIARLGLLFLHKGNWDGIQLISQKWVEEATSVQVPARLPLAGFVDHGPGTYGYNWWVNGTGPDGTRKWPDAPVNTFAAAGYNNNDMFVIPQWDMVIVRLGLDQGTKQITDKIYSTFIGKIGQALEKSTP